MVPARQTHAVSERRCQRQRVTQAVAGLAWSVCSCATQVTRRSLIRPRQWRLLDLDWAAVGENSQTGEVAMVMISLRNDVSRACR